GAALAAAGARLAVRGGHRAEVAAARRGAHAVGGAARVRPAVSIVGDARVPGLARREAEPLLGTPAGARARGAVQGTAAVLEPPAPALLGALARGGTVGVALGDALEVVRPPGVLLHVALAAHAALRPGAAVRGEGGASGFVAPALVRAPHGDPRR